ncbi:MAG: AraC family transcriptional regulator [Lachnospiraceae bacterium]|nr:AraC family transcriptional regulator [Lachnospiraceae bacterium]
MKSQSNSVPPIGIVNDNLNNRFMIRTQNTISASAPDIIFETVHPDDKERNFIFTFINPNTYYSHTFRSDDPTNPATYEQLHYHDYFELIYVITGTMYQQIETERHLYTAGSLCLLNCFISHQEEFSTDFRALFLRLSVPLMRTLREDMDSFYFSIEHEYRNQLIDQYFDSNIGKPGQGVIIRKEYIDFIPREDLPDIRPYMYKLFDKLVKQMVHPEIGSTYNVKRILIQILFELSDSSHYRIVPLNIGTDQEITIFQNIRAQIEIHHGRISRQELEAALSYSGSYLNRIVKKYTGYSIKQFALAVSLKEAVDRLQNSDMSINEICNSLGFSNLTYFYNAFQQKYGTTPKKYRENYHNSLGI